jgi:hypothetical protein
MDILNPILRLTFQHIQTTDNQQQNHQSTIT